jgi:hypothetical protein
MIAFLSLVLLLVVAAVVYFVLIRSSGGSKGEVRVSPVAVDFGDQDLGKRSAVQMVTVENDRSDSADIASIGIQGQDTGDFAVTEETTCSPQHALAGKGSCSIGVRFRPKVREARVAALVVRLAGRDEPLRVELRGTGVGTAAVVLETTRLDLGGVLVGKSRTRSFQLTNAGNAPLAITELGIQGGDATSFRLAKPTDCSNEAKLKAGASCTIAVTFAPKAAGEAAATLGIVHDAQGSPSEVDLRGEGKGRAVPELSKKALDFGRLDVGARGQPASVTLTNAGTGPFTIASVTIAGSNPSDFVLGSGAGCAAGLRLDAGASCTLQVVFMPQSPGDRSATLEVRAGTALIASVSLHGVAVEPGTTTG